MPANVDSAVRGIPFIEDMCSAFRDIFK